VTQQAQFIDDRMAALFETDEDLRRMEEWMPPWINESKASSSRVLARSVVAKALPSNAGLIFEIVARTERETTSRPLNGTATEILHRSVKLRLFARSVP
jgi:hypothetical protein